MALATSDNLKYITSFKDRHGKRRFYFRYHHQKFKLPEKPGDAAFHDSYARYLTAVKAAHSVATTILPTSTAQSAGLLRGF